MKKSTRLKAVGIEKTNIRAALEVQDTAADYMEK